MIASVRRSIAVLALFGSVAWSAAPSLAQGKSADMAIPAPPQPAILPAVPDVAPGYSAPHVTTAPDELIGVIAQPFVGITLADAISMALARNTDLAISQAERKIAGYSIVAAKGAYDVQFQLQPTIEHQVTAPLSAFQTGPGGGPITQDTLGINAGVNANVPGGGQLNVSTNESRVLTNSTVASYSPAYLTGLSFQFTQPLVRGAATDNVRRQLRVANAGAEQQRATTLAQAQAVVANVSNAYWDLVAAWRNVAIQEEGLRNAQAQASSSQRLAQQGAAAPVDAVESYTQIDVFQDNVLQALVNVQRLQIALKTLLVSDPNDAVWKANLVPTSNVAGVPPEPKLEDVIASAFAHRPEVAQLRAQRRVNDANLSFANDQVKPQVDLNLGYATNGLAGSTTNPANNPFFGAIEDVASPPGSITFPPAPAYLNGGLGTSYQNLFDNRFPTYSAGVTVRVPIGNRTATAELATARERTKQLQLQEIALAQRIRGEAVLALQSLRETQYRLVAAQNARSAAERVLQAEQRRFAAGTSTTFLVLQRQLDLANERGRELQAQTDLNKAVVELDRVRGNLLEGAGFDVDRVGATALGASSSTTSGLPVPPARR